MHVDTAAVEEVSAVPFSGSRGVRGLGAWLGRVVLVLLASTLLLGTAMAADEDAGDDTVDVEAMLDAYDQASRDRDANKMMDRLDAMADAYDALEKRDQKSVRIRIAKAIKNRDKRVVATAIKAVAKTKCPQVARCLRPFIKLRDRGKQPEYFADVIAAVRACRPTNAVSNLLKVAEDSRHPATAVLALKGLASYGGEKRYRAKILDTIFGMVRKDKPGVKGRNHNDAYGPNSGEASRNRWYMLSRPMVEMANEMTGQTLTSADEWFDMWNDYKRTPDELFENDQ